MNCCNVETGQRPRRSLWRSATGGVGSGILLILLPKCPLCIAAYLALWTGAGMAIPISTRLRPLLEIVFVASVVLMLVRWMAARVHRERTE